MHQLSYTINSEVLRQPVKVSTTHTFPRFVSPASTRQRMKKRRSTLTHQLRSWDGSHIENTSKSIQLVRLVSKQKQQIWNFFSKRPRVGKTSGNKIWLEVFVPANETLGINFGDKLLAWLRPENPSVNGTTKKLYCIYCKCKYMCI